MERKTNAILRIIARSEDPIGSKEIAEKLEELGISLSERAVRYHLKQMSEKGLLKIFWKEGRMLTRKGQMELEDSLISEKVGLVSSRIESMAYRMDFDLAAKMGKVILNISFFHKSDLSKALKIMRKVFANKLSMGERVLITEPGEEIAGTHVPAGKVGFGTLCAVNLNGLLLNASIPVESKFGGVLQVEDAKPLRFTELVSYAGSTLDPHEIFIRSKMTSVREAAQGNGKMLAGLREIPAVAKNDAEEIIMQAEEMGFGRVLFIGNPGQAALGMPVAIDRVGIVVPGGLNPVAACEEWGIETESKALVTLVDYSQLKSFWEIAG